MVARSSAHRSCPRLGGRSLWLDCSSLQLDCNSLWLGGSPTPGGGQRGSAR